MLRREAGQLAVYQIERETETLPVECLYDLYLKKTSEIVYIVKDNKLYGIVCIGEVFRDRLNGDVRINRNFTTLTGYNVIKAHRIFKEKRNVHKIPVVNEQGMLLGDYSRWDDELYIGRNQNRLMKEEVVKKKFAQYEMVYLVEPIENQNLNYLSMLEYLQKFRVRYTVLHKNQLVGKLCEKALFIFMSEDEIRGGQCQCEIECIRPENSNHIQWNACFVTYKNLLMGMQKWIELNELGIAESDISSYGRIDEKVTILLTALKERGVKCFRLYKNENPLTAYGKDFDNRARERLKKYPINPESSWPKRNENEEFYGELYQQTDYEKEIAQKEIFDANSVFGYRGNITGKYFNAKGGKRVTCFQPKVYIGTIYLFGPCTIMGGFVEDQYTIESYLQEKLLQKGYDYRVENYGTTLRPDAALDSRLQEIDEFSSNDIVVVLSRQGEVVNIPGSSLEKIFEKNHIPIEWVTDSYMHCNHKANQLIADSLFEMVQPSLSDEKAEDCGKGEIQIDFRSVMKSYVRHKYLHPYFADFPVSVYNTVGAIVMNCNPFTKGHRYLIEQARQHVDFLIVFAVEEDLSLFPFEERFKMIVEGTKDLSNVMVVPSGEFILSKNNFQEYFTKEEDKVIALNAEYDINVFADYIAEPLHITYRFAGEEPGDKVTSIYNEAMSKILPQKGITFMEIPRVKMKGEVISASKVRGYLEEEKYERAFALLPETTKQYLMKQIYA